MEVYTCYLYSHQLDLHQKMQILLQYLCFFLHINLVMIALRIQNQNLAVLLSSIYCYHSCLAWRSVFYNIFSHKNKISFPFKQI
nr:MAG TPA: hypothetical protein [Caudoviricetes sp.]